jgi:hypothetical protein
MLGIALKNLFLKRFTKAYLLAFLFISIPMIVISYLYDLHGMLIYYGGFIAGMYFQSRGD